MKFYVCLTLLLVAAACVQQTQGEFLEAKPVYDGNIDVVSLTETDVKNAAVENSDTIFELTRSTIQNDYANSDLYLAYKNDIDTKIPLFENAEVIYREFQDDKIWIPGTEKNYIVKVPIVEAGANWTVEDGVVIVHKELYQENCDVNIENCSFGYVDASYYPLKIVYLVDDRGVFYFGGFE